MYVCTFIYYIYIHVCIDLNDYGRGKLSRGNMSYSRLGGSVQGESVRGKVSRENLSGGKCPERICPFPAVGSPIFSN